MYTDKDIEFAKSWDVTETTAGTRKVSTNIIDLNSPGDADREMFLDIRLPTAIVQPSTDGTVTFTLETHTAATFSTAKTILWSSGAIPEASLTAEASIAKLRIPRGMKRYLAVVATPTTQGITSGTVDAFLTSTIQTND